MELLLLFSFSASIRYEHKSFLLFDYCLTATVFCLFFVSDKTISESRGHTVELKCPIDLKSCGSLHSVKWFKGEERVAIISGDGEIANVEGPYSGR